MLHPGNAACSAHPQTNMGPVYIALSEPRSDVLARPMFVAKTAGPDASAMPCPKEAMNDSVIRRASSEFLVGVQQASRTGAVLHPHGTASPRSVRIFQEMKF